MMVQRAWGDRPGDLRSDRGPALRELVCLVLHGPDSPKRIKDDQHHQAIEYVPLYLIA